MAQTEAIKAYSEFRNSAKRYMDAMGELQQYLPKGGDNAWMRYVLQAMMKAAEDGMGEFDYYEWRTGVPSTSTDESATGGSSLKQDAQADAGTPEARRRCSRGHLRRARMLSGTRKHSTAGKP